MRNIIASTILIIFFSSCTFRSNETYADSAQTDCSVQITKIQEVQFNSNNLSDSVISSDRKVLYLIHSDGITPYKTPTLKKGNLLSSNEANLIGISPDGKIAVSMLNNKIALQDLDNDTQFALLAIPEYHNEKIRIAFSPNRNEIAGSWGACEYGKNVAVWNIHTGKLIWHKQNGFCAGDGIAYSPDGKTIASGVSYSRTMLLWDAQNGAVQEIISEKQPESVSSVAFSQTGKLLAFGTSHTGEGILLAPVIILDTSNNKVLQTFDGKRDTIHSLSISQNDELIAAGTGDGSIILWKIKTGKHLCTLDVGKSNIDVFFTQDNSFVSIQQDGILNLWVFGK